MNTLKKTTLTLVGLGTIAATSFAFADDNESTSHQTSSVRRPMMQEQENGQFFTQYLRTDLTDAEKTTLKTLVQTHQDAMKALFQNTQSGATADTQAQMKTLRDQFITALLPYITTDKQEAFKQSMTTMPEGNMNGDKHPRMNSGTLANFEANITRTVTNISNGVQITETTTDSGTLAHLQKIYDEGRNEKDMTNANISVVRTMLSNGLQSVITSTDAATVTDIQTRAANSPSGYGIGLGYFKKQGDEQKGKTREGNKTNSGTNSEKKTNVSSSNLLPSNISSLIDTKLAKFSTDTEKLAWLNNVNQKIDVLATKITAQKSKNILAALKDLLNQKIDAINNVGVDSTIINDILQ